MQQLRLFLIVSLLFVVAPPPPVLSQNATPAPEFGVVESMSPVALYDALLTTPFPDDLLPEGVATLERYEWRDTNDPDLAGAIGGVVFADADPFGSPVPTTIAYIVYPDVSGAQSALATAAQLGVPSELQVDGQEAPAVLAETGDFVGLFTAIDNVFVYGMVPAGAGGGTEQAAESLARAGVSQLLDLAVAGQDAADAAEATPGSGATRSGEDSFLAVAAAPFPSGQIPFAVGSLVVLPMSVSSGETASGMVGALLVRDADRIYPYPLVFYRFFADESAAHDYVSGIARGAGMSATPEMPSETGLSYPSTTIEQTNDTTTVLVQVGSTIITGNGPAGTLEERHETAMTLAQIAVSHFEEVVVSNNVSRGGRSADGGV